MSIEARFQIHRGEFCLDVDLQFSGSGVSAIFGPSGSGKTTLLRAISGLEKVEQGYLKVGDDVWQDAEFFLPPHKRSIGYIFQEPSLFPHLNVRRNIDYGKQRSPENGHSISIEDTIELLGIGSLMERFPTQLSGGEQQRVAIARALATSPTVLLMDEPLAALDDARKQDILPYFESLHRELEIPILYVSHAKEEIMHLGDQVVVLEQGRVSAQGEVADIFTRLSLPMAHDVDAKSVVGAVVSEQDTEFGLSYLDFSGGRFAVPTHERLSPGNTARLLIRASDVSITLEPASGTSIMNIFAATIEDLMEGKQSHTTVKLKIEATSIMATITRKSAAVLNLQTGMKVFVQIKSVALLV